MDKLELTTVGNDNLLGSAAGIRSHRLDLFDNVHALLNLAEDDVLTIEPAGDDGGDEELGTVSVTASVGHREETGAIVLKLEVLVLELGSVDRLTTSTVSSSKVTALKHELRDDTVENAPLIMEAVALLASAKGAEIFGSLRDDIGKELEGDAADLIAVGSNVEEDNGVGHGGGTEESSERICHTLAKFYRDQGTMGA